MKSITFVVPGEPTPKGRPCATVRRHGAKVWASTYTPAKTRAAEETFAARACAFAPKSPLTGPLVVTLEFTFAPPASWPKWQREAALRGEYLNVNAKDIDNLAKAALDAMNGLFFVDDRQVFSLHVEKMYGEVPQTEVSIQELVQVTRERNPA